MWTRQGRRRPLGRLALIGATAAVCLYFGHHAVNGANGWNARDARLARLAELRAVVTELADERAAVERRNALINGTVVERDVVDERARALLGVVREDEIVVLLPLER